MAYGRLDIFWPDGKFESHILDAASVSIGRSTGNTITLDTDTISRYHMSITFEEGQIYVTDLDSANGTFVDGAKLNSNSPELLEGVQEIQIGHLRMIFQPIDDSPTLPMSAISDETQRIEKADVAFKLQVHGPEIDVSPGAYTSAEIAITNTAEQIQTFQIEVSGMPDGWIRINRPNITLDPNETGQVLLNIKPLRRADSTPGTYPVKIAVRGKDSPNKTLEAEMHVNILPFGGFGMALVPKKVESGEVFRLHTHNQGSAELPLSISGRNRFGHLRFDIPTAQFRLSPGQRLQVQGEIKPKQPRWFGAPRQHKFDLVVKASTPAGFIAAVEGTFIEKPRFPAWVGISGAGIFASLALIMVLLLVVLLRPRPPEPNIAVFSVNSTQIAQGEPLSLSWQATDVASFSVSLNGTPVIIEISPDVPGVSLETGDLHGSVSVVLQGVNGDVSDQEVQVVQIYRPMFVESFTAEPPRLVRNVAQSLSLDWNVPGAVYTRISGLESFSTAALQPSYGAQDSIMRVLGIPAEPFTVTLFAEDEVGNTLEQPIAIEVINPECSPTQGEITLRFGPNALHQVVGTVPAGAAVVVNAQDDSGQWIRAELPGGTMGWGPRSLFTCADTFNPDDLRKEINVPAPPTLTPTPTATASYTPSPTVTNTIPPTLTPSRTPRPTNTLRATATAGG
jgi:hypothetical protein